MSKLHIRRRTSHLFLGKEHHLKGKKSRPALQNQWLLVRHVWNNEHYTDFGLERIIRLFLALVLFLFPGLYIREVFGKMGVMTKKISIEIYVLLKLFLPLFLFKFDLTGQLWAAVLSTYLLLETVLYLTSLIFLSNEFEKPISHRRSLTTLIINYVEICLNYAVIYSYCNHNIPQFFNHYLQKDIQVIYFSFATSATVGYGDIVMQNSLGQALVISQIILFIIFLALFVNYFVARVHDPMYMNDKED